jgi:hypothetical protein
VCTIKVYRKWVGTLLTSATVRQQQQLAFYPQWQLKQKYTPTFMQLHIQFSAQGMQPCFYIAAM